MRVLMGVILFFATCVSPVGMEARMLVKASATSTPRDYYAPISPRQKKDLSYIVNTLSKSSLVSLMRQKRDLERAGDRINNIHPLRFLIAIFTDEELKVGIRNIPKGWVWDDFMKGLRDSLNEEAGRGNMRVDCIEDFARVLEINMSSIMPAIQSRRWEELVSTLIAIIPRKGDTKRYGM